MRAPAVPATVILAALAAGGLAFYVWRKGGVSQAAQALGAGAVRAVDGAASGVVGAVGEVAGLPTPSQTTTDPYVARWLIDRAGYFQASLWASAPALLRAATMPAGSGRPPSAGSLLAAQFPVLPVAEYDEVDRLLRRYPAPVTEQDAWRLPVWGDTSTWGAP